MVVNLQTTLPKMSARLPPTREMVTDGEAFLSPPAADVSFILYPFFCVCVFYRFMNISIIALNWTVGAFKQD